MLDITDDDRLSVVTYSTYLDRLILRTHLPSDDEQIAAIFSSPQAMKHLSDLAPPLGWSVDRPKGIWMISDVSVRVAVHHQARRDSRSCVFNAIVRETGGVLGTTGFVRMEPVGTPGRKAELGIILDVDGKFARKGYATEAMHGAVKYAFEELEGIEEITIQTNSLNQEMRGWSENVAGLRVKEEIRCGIALPKQIGKEREGSVSGWRQRCTSGRSYEGVGGY